MASLLTDVALLVTLSMLIVSSSCMNVNTGFQEELMTRIQSLELQGHKQGEKMQSLELQIQAQNERLASQEATIDEYKQRVKDLEQTVGAQNIAEQPLPKYANDHLEVVNKNNGVFKDGQSANSLSAKGPVISTKMRNMALSATVQKQNLANQGNHIKNEDSIALGLQKSMKAYAKVHGDNDHGFINFGEDKGKHRQRRMLLDSGDTVAFHAVIAAASQIEHMGVNQTIIFPDALLNVGGAYHSGTGTFIAPKDGLYMFSATITSYIHNLEFLASIVKNGGHLVGVYAHGDENHNGQGSATVVTKLTTGDEVWVLLVDPADATLWGGKMTSFTGFLIFAL